MNESEITVVKKRLKLNKKNLFWLLAGVGIFLVIIVGIVFAVSMVSKNNKMCTVTFESSGGSQVNSIEFKCAMGIVKKPSNPTKEGFRFLGWYLGNEKFDFEKAPNKDIKLSARWEVDGIRDIVKVILNTNGGTDMDDVELIKGTRLVISTAPEKEGYKFLGWFLNDEEFDFTKEINESIELKAKWEANDESNNSLSADDRCYGSVGKSHSASLAVGTNSTIGGIFNIGLNYNKNCKITYKSSDGSIALIDNAGNISTKKKGSTSMYACITDKKTNVDIDCFKGTLNVVENSQNQEIDSFSLAFISRMPDLDDFFTLSPSFDRPFYGDFSEQIADIKISDSRIIEIVNIKNMEFKAIGIGDATITVVLKNGVSASVTLTIYPEKQVPLEKIVSEKDIVTLNSGEKTKIKLTVYPEYRTYKMIAHSEDSSIAVAEADGTIIAKNPGVTVIKFSASTEIYGLTYGIKHSVKVVVNEIKMTSLKLDRKSISLNIGDTDNLIATFLPANATYKNLNWSSSDSSVVSVNYVGGISARKKGTATITVTNKDGSLKDTCVVTVNEIEVQSITLDKGDLTLVRGTQESISATVSPANATNKTVTWSSSNPSVATINDGVIMAVANGETTITASSGDKSASIKVTVTDPPFMVEGSIGVFMMQLGDYVTYDVYGTAKAKGGAGGYTYSLEIYRDDVLIKKVENSSEDTLYTGQAAPGTYYVVYRVSDAAGRGLGGVSEKKVIS